MPDDRRMRDHNEAIRQARIEAERDAIKRHGEKMDEAVSGGRRGGGSCLVVLVLLAGAPGAASAFNWLA